MIGLPGSYDVAEFNTTNNANCGYKRYLRAWIPSPNDDSSLPLAYQQLPIFITLVVDDSNPLKSSLVIDDLYVRELKAYVAQYDSL